MDIAEWEEGTECAECGEPVTSAVDEGFGFGEAAVLCFECAIRRGGVYDADKDEWVTAPDLTGLDRRAPAIGAT